MSWLKALIGPITDAFNGWRERKHEIRMEKHNLKKVEVETSATIKIARAEAEVRMWSERQAADINWELESIKNSGWKDEYLTIFTTGIILAAFIPHSQPYVAEGFDVLTNNTPMWFQVMAAVVWSSAFGVRVFDKYQTLVGGRNAKS